MGAWLETIGLTSGETTQLIVLGIVLLLVLVLARIAFKLTVAIFRIGCFGILLIMAAVFVLNLLN